MLIPVNSYVFTNCYPMKPFGDAVRQLMEAKKVSGLKLAESIEITPTSVSRILNGQSRPRQLTLTRIMKKLCDNAEEEQLIVRAYTGLIDNMPDEPEAAPRPIPQDEVERVTRYLEVKSMSVAFRKDVESVLTDLGIIFDKDFRNDPFICDFMLELQGRRVAIDCKYNVNRDWDRTYATVKLLRENLPCDEVVIAIPYENDQARKARNGIESVGGRIIDVKELQNFF